MMQRCAFLLLLGVLAFLTYDALTIDRYSWDLTVSEGLQSVDAERLGPVPRHLFWMGILGVAGAAMLVVTGWLWLKGWRAEALFVAGVGLFDALNAPLRYFIGRPRPGSDLVVVLSEPQGWPTAFGFPSGSAMHVIMFCGIIIYLSRYVFRPSPLRSAAWVLLSLYTAMVGIWVVYAGRHWMSDVLGAYVYGALFLWVLVWGYHKYVTWRRAYPKEHIPTERLPTLARPFAWIVTTIY